MTGFVAAALVTIQMSLDCNRSYCGVARDVEPEVPSRFAAASLVAIVGGVSAIAINASSVVSGRASGRAAGWFGVAAGALGLGLFIGSIDQGDEYGTWRFVNAGVGVTSLFVGLHALKRQGASAEPAGFTAAPWRGPRGATGMRVSVSF